MSRVDVVSILQRVSLDHRTTLSTKACAFLRTVEATSTIKNNPSHAAICIDIACDQLDIEVSRQMLIGLSGAASPTAYNVMLQNLNRLLTGRDDLLHSKIVSAPTSKSSASSSSSASRFKNNHKNSDGLLDSTALSTLRQLCIRDGSTSLEPVVLECLQEFFDFWIPTLSPAQKVHVRSSDSKFLGAAFYVCSQAMKTNATTTTTTAAVGDKKKKASGGGQQKLSGSGGKALKDLILETTEHQFSKQEMEKTIKIVQEQVWDYLTCLFKVSSGGAGGTGKGKGKGKKKAIEEHGQEEERQEEEEEEEEEEENDEEEKEGDDGDESVSTATLTTKTKTKAKLSERRRRIKSSEDDESEKSANKVAESSQVSLSRNKTASKDSKVYSNMRQKRTISNVSVVSDVEEREVLTVVGAKKRVRTMSGATAGGDDDDDDHGEPHREPTDNAANSRSKRTRTGENTMPTGSSSSLTTAAQIMNQGTKHSRALRGKNALPQGAATLTSSTSVAQMQARIRSRTGVYAMIPRGHYKRSAAYLNYQKWQVEIMRRIDVSEARLKQEQEQQQQQQQQQASGVVDVAS